jgi:3-carboxy-cis,cis-muconate cycloisomerase
VTFEPIFVPGRLAVAVSDRSWVAAMLEFEQGLANASAIAGAIPAQAAGPIAEACDVDRFDVAAIVEAGRSPGNPAEPLVRALRAAVGGEAADYVHFGATSQDAVDTAAMLVARRALSLVDDELAGVARACAALAERHRSTPMAGRTLLQQAVPTTFGLKAAGWLVAVCSGRRRLDDLRRGLAVQLGGAAGTLAALGQSALAVLAGLAVELDLSEPTLPWHSDRSRPAELGSALAQAAGSCAKIGLDVALLEQTEVAEVREPPGSGASSTMPHKRNPVGSALAIACARRTQAAAGILAAGLVAEHERSLGCWQAEWGALSDALAYGGGAAAAMRGALEQLEVDAVRMRANLDAGGGAVLSERLTFLLAARTGHAEARARVAEAAAGAGGSAEALRARLAGDLTEADLDAALDPATYLGAAPELVDRALALFRESDP